MTSTSGNLISPVSRTLYLPVAVGGLYQRPSPVPVDSSTSKAATWEPQVKTCSWCCSTGRMRRPVDPRVAQAHISRVRFKQQLAAEGAVRVGMDFNTPRVRFELPDPSTFHRAISSFNTPRVRFELEGKSSSCIAPGTAFNTPRVRFELEPESIASATSPTFNTPRVRFEPALARLGDAFHSGLSIPQGYDSN